jgi:D-alanine-D-alanine ligase
MKINSCIEIVRSTNPGLSYMSQSSCSAACAVLSKQFLRVRITVVNNLADLEALVDRQPDLVFLGMEYIPLPTNLGVSDTNKIWLSEYFDEHGIAYTGSDQAAHMFGRNKPLAKQRMLDANLGTAAYCVLEQDQAVVSSDVPFAYPLFIKPANRGGGLGISSESVVHNFEQLRVRANYISNEIQSDSLVEEYLSGREFSVAVLKDNYSKEYLVMPIELVAPTDENGARLLSGQVKSSNVEQVLEVADNDIRAKVVRLALESFHALGARDYGRIDIRLDDTGVPHFLEANLIPSLISGYGSFPKACLLNIGLEYGPMIIAIAELGLARNLNDQEDVPEPSAIGGATVILGTI